MSKRNDAAFEKLPNDKYYTPEKAVLPLLPFLPPRTRFVEPCAGDGRLIDHLTRRGHKCIGALDIEPERGDIQRGDATALRVSNAGSFMFITNPPWTRDILHPLIRNLAAQAPCWFLFEADWMSNAHATQFRPLLRDVVLIGRVKWFEGSDSNGKDNIAWYHFDGTRPPGSVEIHLRA